MKVPQLANSDCIHWLLTSHGPQRPHSIIQSEVITGFKKEIVDVIFTINDISGNIVSKLLSQALLKCHYLPLPNLNVSIFYLRDIVFCAITIWGFWMKIKRNYWISLMMSLLHSQTQVSFLMNVALVESL